MFAEDQGSIPSDPVIQLASKDSKIRIIERFSKVVKLDDRITRVDGFDDEVLDVTALDARSIRVRAVSPGVTTLTLSNENGDIYSVNVLVTGDVRHLQVQLNELFPDASVEAREVNDAVLLRGWVTAPEQITQMVEVAERFYPTVLNHMIVGAPQQVLLKVKIMEVQRSLLRRFGLNWIYADGNGLLTSSPGSVISVNQIADPDTGGISPAVAAASLATPTNIFTISNNAFAFTGFIDALKQEQLLKILAEPNLVATNGRPAHLLQGGEFPILVPSGLGTVGVEFREFGVRMEAVPIVLGHDQVRIQLQAEVSDRDFNNSVEVNGIRVPALTTRRANTQVELGFGETLMIAGLINNSNTATTSKTPFLGDLPWIGALFSHKQFTEGETELVIMVTPELIAPMEPGQVPPGGPGSTTDVPTDKELFFYNLIEVPSYGGPCGDRLRDPGGVATEPGLASPPGFRPPGPYGPGGYYPPEAGMGHGGIIHSAPPSTKYHHDIVPTPAPLKSLEVPSSPPPAPAEPKGELKMVPPNSPTAQTDSNKTNVVKLSELPMLPPPTETQQSAAKTSSSSQLQPVGLSMEPMPGSSSPRKKPGLIQPDF
ncbi:type II and III secretion system protein family protein [Calycomorphotria hydatis]|uniref:type II and III secretion system protein family protein n=1 Tax=Calycomorphotria hydatis TaxID=2528027 RepID=UPI0018D208BD|nr:pilus assembly protein N-terminal domain-containing protein [Calycomorphotria hydatis]